MNRDNCIGNMLASNCRLFTDAQLSEIHFAALEILRHTGVRVHDDEVLSLLYGTGCVIEDKALVKFPEIICGGVYLIV